MCSRGAVTVNEARRPGSPSGRFTASTTTSPAKRAAQSLLAAREIVTSGIPSIKRAVHTAPHVHLIDHPSHQCLRSRLCRPLYISDPKCTLEILPEKVRYCGVERLGGLDVDRMPGV